MSDADAWECCQSSPRKLGPGTEVTPRAFVHRGGIPYLVAYCHLDAFEKAFRLDRVRRYEVVRDGGGADRNES